MNSKEHAKKLTPSMKMEINTINENGEEN